MLGARKPEFIRNGDQNEKLRTVLFIPRISDLLPADIMNQVGSFNSAVGVKKISF